MTTTSNGVRCFERAYARSSFFQLRWKAWSCAPTSCFDVVLRRKSYVAGKRKPSSVRASPSPANRPGSFDEARRRFGLVVVPTPD